MRVYKVQPGDTLIGIAQSQLGNTALWREIADLNNITNPAKLRIGQTLTLPDTTGHPAPNVSRVSERIIQEVRIAVQNNLFMAFLDDSEEEFLIGKKFRKGVYRVGNQKPERFVKEHKNLLSNLNLSESEQNIIYATAENEGCLDAINSWDANYLSFGMFQWTAGRTGQPGELPKLLQLVQLHETEAFEQYFQQFDLGVTDVGPVTGWLTMKNEKLSSQEHKNPLREPIWAYRFARAGMDPRVKSVQILHSINRLDQFYFKPSSKLDHHSLSDLITCEYGVALLLDNHVNRPAWVVPCVAQAMQDLSISPQQLKNGDDATEAKIIDQYLKIRTNYSSSRTPAMTDATKRAEITRSYLNNGTIQSSKHSFQSNRNQREA